MQRSVTYLQHVPEVFIHSVRTGVGTTPPASVSPREYESVRLAYRIRKCVD